MPEVSLVLNDLNSSADNFPYNKKRLRNRETFSMYHFLILISFDVRNIFLFPVAV